MAVITIDGIRLEVPEDKNVLDCALEAGIYIPHLCHHKNLSPLGSCRMCNVEVEGQEGLTTSCTLKVKDGMNIRTNSPEIERRRMLALELLLAGHPEDCSTCPKYGNCELQMLIQYIGPKTGRLKMRTKGFQTEERNPLTDKNGPLADASGFFDGKNNHQHRSPSGMPVYVIRKEERSYG